MCHWDFQLGRDKEDGAALGLWHVRTGMGALERKVAMHGLLVTTRGDTTLKTKGE